MVEEQAPLSLAVRRQRLRAARAQTLGGFAESPRHFPARGGRSAVASRARVLARIQSLAALALWAFGHDFVLGDLHTPF